MRISPLSLCAALVLASASFDRASAQTVEASTITYQAWNQSNTTAPACNGNTKETSSIYIPSGSAEATYPVHIYLTGTGMSHEDQPILDLLEHTAQRGYLSVSVQYDNSQWELLWKNSCLSLGYRTQCVFDGPQSALGKICAHENADCSKGVVVTGFSQGAALAVMAKNYDDRVRAALVLGGGDILHVPWYLGGNKDLRACVDDGTRELSSNRLRVLTGDSDDMFGGTEARIRPQLNRLTGVTTCTEQDCFWRNADAGYYLVNASDLSESGTTPASAEHTFFLSSSGGQTEYNWYFECSDEPWGLHESYAWLASFGDTDRSTVPSKAPRCATPPSN